MSSNDCSRRDFLKAVGFGAAALSVASSGCLSTAKQAGGGKRPNIIFMLADDLGYGDLGCYGCPDIKTPNIDRMAMQGARFTDGYASSPICSPTRAAFVTGRYQQRLGNKCEYYMGAGCPGLKPEKHPSIAMYLKEAGYKTACYGKWNISGIDEDDTGPNDHGFDHWVGLHHNFNYLTHASYDFVSGKWDGPPKLYEDGKPLKKPGFITDLLADYAIKYIENSAEEPFFIYIPWQAPHYPMQAPDDDPKITDLPKKEAAEDRPIYIKIVERMDYQVGRMINALERKGIAENTLVIFTSDNGGHKASRNLPLKGFKLSLNEGGIRVPFIMYQPGTIIPGQVTEQPAITMDATATIAALAGAKVPQAHAMDGINLMPYVTGRRKPDKNRTLYWRYRVHLPNRKINKVMRKAIRQGHWKYYHDLECNEQYLYNLKQDIGEKNNLIDQKPKIAARLKKKLNNWEKQVTPKTPPLVPETY